MGFRKPLSNEPHTPWLPWQAATAQVRKVMPGATFYKRYVHDGFLRCLVTEDPVGWHLSISHAYPSPLTDGTQGRYPGWDEIADARDRFLPDTLDFVMWLPKATEYVNIHDTCFHLHEHPPRTTESDGRGPKMPSLHAPETPFFRKLAEKGHLE